MGVFPSITSSRFVARWEEPQITVLLEELLGTLRTERERAL